MAEDDKTPTERPTPGIPAPADAPTVSLEADDVGELDEPPAIPADAGAIATPDAPPAVAGDAGAIARELDRLSKQGQG